MQRQRREEEKESGVRQEISKTENTPATTGGRGNMWTRQDNDQDCLSAEIPEPVTIPTDVCSEIHTGQPTSDLSFIIFSS